MNRAVFHYRSTVERARIGWRWSIEWREEIPEGVPLSETQGLAHLEGLLGSPRGWALTREAAYRRAQAWIFNHRTFHGWPAWTLNDVVGGAARSDVEPLIQRPTL